MSSVQDCLAGERSSPPGRLPLSLRCASSRCQAGRGGRPAAGDFAVDATRGVGYALREDGSVARIDGSGDRRAEGIGGPTDPAPIVAPELPMRGEPLRFRDDGLQ